MKVYNVKWVKTEMARGPLKLGQNKKTLWIPSNCTDACWVQPTTIPSRPKAGQGLVTKIVESINVQFKSADIPVNVLKGTRGGDTRSENILPASQRGRQADRLSGTLSHHSPLPPT